jgi:tetratricopeptide (TPR) repeat protein
LLVVVNRIPSAPPRRFTIAAAVVVAVLVVVYGLWGGGAPSLDDAEEAFLAGDFDRAEKLALAWVETAPPDLTGQGLDLAHRCAVQSERFADAVTHVERMPDASEAFSRLATVASDFAIHRLREFSRAERLLERISRLKPADSDLLERRAYLYGLTNRAALAEPLRLELVRRGARVWTLLWLLCLHDDALENTELLADVDESTSDPLTLLALARFAGERGRLELGRRALQRAIDRGAPVEARVLDARWARERGDEPGFARVLADTADVEDSAALWWLRGVWCEGHGRAGEAIRCHAEALALQPNLSRSLVPLARLLDEKGIEAGLARRLRARAADLAEYLNAVKAVRQEQGRTQWTRVTRLCRRLSLGIETAGWWSMGRPEWRDDPSLSDVRDWLAATENTAPAQPPRRTLPEGDPLAGFDRSIWPVPRFDDAARTEEKTPRSNPAAGLPDESAIRFEDVAPATGLHFTFEPYPGRTAAGPRMFEFTGGGVSVCDFDRDGWLDTFWGQGVPWPAGRSTPPGPGNAEEGLATGTIDRLFRNIEGRSWRDVTRESRARDTGFTQGVAACDLDGDGFSELIVANIGGASVLWNRGDGTFETAPLPVAAGWSTSLAVADFTEDGQPDVYVVRYLGGPEVYARTCPDSDNRPHSCLPQHFPAESDMFLRSQGDGSFVDDTQAAGFVESDGKGLGAAAADFNGDGRLDLFVANDTTPNFLWIRQPRGDAAEPAFRDEGLASGLALNGDGRAQADMGIALDDADGNGLFDLFVTKFFNETNTLSLQVRPGEFVDMTGGSGLGESSLRMLGFGTQFVDADLDGRPDIALVNGHIDDARHRGEPFEMRPQFYRNLGTGRFKELRADAVGECFARESLGRGMARGDWNHDGREDLFASHIGSPATLFENRSPNDSSSTADWLSLELVATSGAREPIGAVVELIAGRTRLVKVLPAGDGYLSSNTRRITFGLRGADPIQRIEIRWPGGHKSMVEGVAPGARWLVVEGRSAATPLP